MTPPCYTFAAAELGERVQLDVQGRQRKAVDSASRTDGKADGKADVKHPIDLRACALLSSMVQYSCTVARPHDPTSPVRCLPVQRMFRRCADRNGSFMVETTAWEDRQAGIERQ